MRNRTDAGFTLIELLVVVVVIGILAAIAVAKYDSVRKNSFVAAAETDMRNLLVKQEMYQTNNYTYTADLDELEFTESPGVNISINTATNTGWAATASHDAYDDIQCGVFVGTALASDAAPATLSERVTCVP